MWGGNIYVWSYLNGLFASLGGCTLPVLSLIAAKLNDPSFNKWKFLAEFFLAQFLLFSALNLAAATVYSIFQELQPLLLLVAAAITFILATSMYLGRPLPVPSVGGIYGLALSPCSVGFAVATAASSMDHYSAILNAFLFSLGVVIPIAAVTFVLGGIGPVARYAGLIERAGTVLLFVVSFYLAYLAGSSWRWIP